MITKRFLIQWLKDSLLFFGAIIGAWSTASLASLTDMRLSFMFIVFGLVAGLYAQIIRRETARQAPTVDAQKEHS